MKKTIAFLLAFGIVISLIACGDVSTTVKPDADTSSPPPSNTIPNESTPSNPSIEPYVPATPTDVPKNDTAITTTDKVLPK